MFDPGAAGRDIGAGLPQPGESSEVLISSLTLRGNGPISAGGQIKYLRVRWSKITINLYRALNISDKS